MSNDDEGIYRVDTVPPPNGENDAYNAPTKVGPMATAIVEKMLAQGRREAPPSEAQPVAEHADVPDEGDATALVDEATLAANLAAAKTKAKESSNKVTPLATPAPIPALATPAAEPPPASVEPAVLSTKATDAKEGTATSSAAKSGPSNLVLFVLVVALAAIGFYLLRR